MAKFWGILLSFCSLPLISVQAADRTVSYLDEVYSLGSVAGQGLACQARKYDEYELLARAIMIGKAQNAEQQKEGIQQYNTGKAEAFMAMEDENFAACDEVNAEFDNQKIFKSTLYSDGRIKLYDGTMITPRKSYNAARLYEKDPDAFAKADAAYKEFIAAAENNGKNAQKIKLRDANYDKYSDQF
jgi:hypothetical protein